MTVGSVNPAKPAGTVALTTSVGASVNARLPDVGDSLVITNTTSGVVFAKCGPQASAAATEADYPILPNSRALMAAGPYVNFVAIYAPSGATGGTVYATVIDGTQY